MEPALAPRFVGHDRARWPARYPAAIPPDRRCAIEDLAAGVARALVDAQAAFDRRADEGMQRWEEDGIPPSAIMLRTCRLRFDVAPSVLPGRDARERTRIVLAPGRSGASRMVLGFSADRQKRVRR